MSNRADKFGMDDVKPVTSTAGRRHRPSTKEKPAETRGERHDRKARLKSASKPRVTARREDKREDPNEMVTDAAPMNVVAERNNKKRKGKSTHSLEARGKGKRPSRKSTRGGANHVKPDSPQRRQTTRALRSPKSRHASASG